MNAVVINVFIILNTKTPNWVTISSVYFGIKRVPVFKISVDKKTVLYDQDPDLLSTENAQMSVDEVNGSQIIVGSLVDVSNSGNWPPIYDKKKQN